MTNWLAGYFVIALFLSMLDRYFSGEDFKKSEWINGKSFKFKLGLSLVVVMTPFFFGGFFTTNIFVAPFSLIGMMAGLIAGDFFLRTYDWAFKAENNPKDGQKAVDDSNSENPADGEPPDNNKASSDGDNTAITPRPSVVEAIQDAGSNIKEGLKSVGEGIVKASEKIFKDYDKKEKTDNGESVEKKTYESNKKLDDKLNNY